MGQSFTLSCSIKDNYVSAFDRIVFDTFCGHNSVANQPIFVKLDYDLEKLNVFIIRHCLSTIFHCVGTKKSQTLSPNMNSALQHKLRVLNSACMWNNTLPD